MLNDHPVIVIIGAIATVVGVAVGVLSLVEPEHPVVTDGEICGYSEEIQTTRPHLWQECENPSKVTDYRFSETVKQSSGQVGGGRDQNWHCTNVKRAKEAAVGESIVWSNQKSSEQSDMSWDRHATYKYHCEIDAKWGPIYKVERWEGCGEAPPVVLVNKEPKTCIDDTRRVGWKWKWE